MPRFLPRPALVSPRQRRTLLVTGASSGIGRAVALLAGARGYDVAVNFRSSDKAARAVADEIVAGGARADTFRADIGNPDEVKRLFSEIAEQLAPPTFLVNNAGSLPARRLIMDWDIEAIQAEFNTCLLGAIECTRQTLLNFGSAGDGAQGAVVNISSEAGRFGGNGIAVYAAAKAALNTLTVSLAREFGREGLRVNAVSPGLIGTDAFQNAQTDRIESLAASVPLGRVGAPEDVAEAVLWLLSDEARYVNGAVLPVSGGR